MTHFTYSYVFELFFFVSQLNFQSKTSLVIHKEGGDLFQIRLILIRILKTDLALNWNLFLSDLVFKKDLLQKQTCFKRCCVLKGSFSNQTSPYLGMCFTLNRPFFLSKKSVGARFLTGLVVTYLEV